MKLTNHFHLMLKLRMGGTIPPFSLWLYGIEIHRAQGLLYFVNFLNVVLFPFLQMSNLLLQKEYTYSLAVCFPYISPTECKNGTNQKLLIWS